MSGWASLSGYLSIKPGGGGLSLLKTRKRLWCVLEESQGRLLYFKNEDDARSKVPIGYIEIRGAAITLDMDSHNQFIIIVDGKEIQLTAENHESMMIWLMALQARRDQFALAEKSRTSSTSTENDFDLDLNFLEVVESRERVGFDLNLSDRSERSSAAMDDILAKKRLNYIRSASDLSIVRTTTELKPTPMHQPRAHKPLEATQSLQGQSLVATVGFLGLSPDWRRNQLKKMGDTIDNSHPSAKIFEKDRSLSLPPLLEESALSHLHSGSRQLSMSMRAQRMTQNDVIWSTQSSSSSTDNSDDLYMGSGHQSVSRSASDKDSETIASTAPQEETSQAEVPDDEGRVSDLEKELIATKCELAKVLNKQSCFQEILKQKDEIIEDLDEKLGNRSFNSEGYDSKKRGTAVNKEHQERVRVLQNQNRFLNEEVRRLAKLRSQEHDKIKIQESKVRKLEADIEVWKLEYISLIQSSIRFTGTDTMDDAELSLYGGDRHKNRIISLLEEARKINPSLPTFELLSRGEVHVDTYGFKHHFSDEGLLLHYLCQELSQHFLCQASSYEKHQRNWLQYLKNNTKQLMANKKTLKALVRNGIPDVHRKTMWKAFVMAQVEDIIIEKGAHYFRSLCNSVPDSPLAARYRKQISLDLMRTMPTNVKFSTQGCKGIMDLQDVLLAFCIHNPHVGYCQGMNFLVAMALLFMDAQDAFWTLVAVTERYHSPSYFDHNLLGAQADQAVLHDLMSEKLSELAKHLDAIDIEISTVTLNWFLALFFDAVPFPTLLRIWDCFLLEGPKVLFRFSLAILHIHSKEIIMKCDTISVMRHLKACAKITYDVDGLVMAAFKTLKPFPRRQDIVSKQTCYLNALKEKYKWRDMQRVTYAERENVYLSMECDADKYTGFECCTVTKPGEAWVAYSDPPFVKICIVDCKEQTMTDTNIIFETRVLSMVYANDDMVLIGTLSWFVFSYSQSTKELLWQQRLHDAVLSMQVYQDEDGDKMYRLFAGLADGTIAVFEAVSSQCTNYDLFYLPVGQSPVTCLQVLGNKLWCACGNNVSIINASTLDPKDRFTVSTNPYDTILSLVPGLPGVWISVRGSSVLELWDPENITCKMLYDTRTGKFPNLRKEDETYFNAARITSILSLDYNVWVGTGEGILITFDVFSQGQKTPSEASSFMAEAFLSGDLELQSWQSSSQKSDVESLARLVEVEKRVKELIHRQGTDGDDSIDQSNMDDSNSSYLEIELPGMDSDLKNIGINSRENSMPNVKDHFDQRNIFSHDVNFENKMDLTKTWSADSAHTEFSIKTNTSGVSSNYSHHSDISDTIAPDVVSMYDSGYAQPKEPFKNIQQVTVIPVAEKHIADVIHLNLPIHKHDEVTTRPSSNEDKTCKNYPQDISNVNKDIVVCYEKRASRKSADSGISSIHEKITKETEQRFESSVNGLSCTPQESTECSAELVTDLNNEVPDSPDSIHFQSEENDEVSKTKVFILSNERSVSLESNKTAESDDVFQENSIRDGGDTTNKDTTTNSQEEIDLKDNILTDNTLQNDIHLNLTYENNLANKFNGDILSETNRDALNGHFVEEHIEKTKSNTILRRVQSLKKNFKVDLNLSSNKKSSKLKDKFTDQTNPNLSQHISSSVGESVVVTETLETQDINHNLTSPSSVSKELVTFDISDSQQDAVHKLSNSSTTPLEMLVDADKNIPDNKTFPQEENVSRPLNGEPTYLQSNVRPQNTNTPNFTPSENSAMKHPISSQQEETEQLSIDTKFYGDSDEDSVVHEARVQSFKDSYKKMSNANLKFKLLNDIIPENANVQVQKVQRAPKLSGNKDSYTSSETHSKSSDFGSLYHSTGSPKKPLSVIGRQSSDASIILGNIQPKDPDAQWRLDYTNIHVDTDLEGSVMSIGMHDGLGGDVDSSLPSSRRLSCISTNSDLKDQRMNQFLRDTASSYSSHLCLSSEDDKMMAFLSTPNMSDCNSAGWSSYDDISTPSQDNDSVRYRMPRPSAYNMESRATSIASTLDLYAGGTDLALMSKNKISDKPVKWLLSTQSEGRPVILSFSGSHSDDEAALLWSREAKETLWTNAPILEYNPTTKRATLPSYMRPQLASSARTSPRIKITSHSGT
ncbi:uncharacterized protein LOC106079591 isoform X5 [Biomphalaria glabrata]|uniref:Uncharacterized protein LOC106079591 isoform X5 n=1 Tax=Biomphalaria glabrata TaxID=6526 RepID=A0A9W3B9K8_BIOGL|nr:uncharacterized protein LOC106079591 isoform X5 [Biomphalaria glabrata]